MASHLISDVSQVQVLAEIGIVLLLFTIGMEFSSATFCGGSPHSHGCRSGPDRWRADLGDAGRTCSRTVLSTGNFLGFFLSLSSTAIVLKALSEQGESDSFHGRATVAILIFQDLAVVPMMLITPILATPSGSAMGMVLTTLLKAALVVGLIVAAAWYLVPRLLRHIVRSRSRELFLLSIIVLCLGIAWLTSLGGCRWLWVHLSPVSSFLNLNIAIKHWRRSCRSVTVSTVCSSCPSEC